MPAEPQCQDGNGRVAATPEWVEKEWLQIDDNINSLFINRIRG